MPKKISSKLPQVLIIAGVTVLAIGILVATRQQATNKQIQKQAAANSSSAPSTQKPSASDFDNYKTAPDQPRYIFIASIGVKAMVRSLGTTTAGQIESPANVYDAGWFNQSSKPGQPGAMVIDGHVSSWSTKGVFSNLKQLTSGQTIVIEKGDSTKVTYVVIKTQVYDAKDVDMPAVLNPIEPNKPGLNLITCAGSVVKGTNDFDKRLVVFAVMQ